MVPKISGVNYERRECIGTGKCLHDKTPLESMFYTYRIQKKERKVKRETPASCKDLPKEV